MKLTRIPAGGVLARGQVAVEAKALEALEAENDRLREAAGQARAALQAARTLLADNCKPAEVEWTLERLMRIDAALAGALDEETTT